MSKPQARLAWPDIAKGISILGVILLHACLAVPDGMDSTLAAMNRFLDPLRMPLFFLVSGYFSGKILNYSFGELFFRRLWFFVVPYLAWVPVELWLKFRELHANEGQEIPGVKTYLWHIFFGENMFWFLYALVIFNIVLWLTRNLRPTTGLLVGFSPLLLVPFHSNYFLLGSAILYLPIFIAGTRLRPLISEHAAHYRDKPRILRSVLMAMCGYGLFFFWSVLPADSIHAIPMPGTVMLGYEELHIVSMLLIKLLVLPAGILAVAWLAHIPVLSKALQFLGRHTLPLYLAHPIGNTLVFGYLALGSGMVVRADADSLISRTTTWVLILVVVGLVGGLVFHGLSRLPIVGWILTPPSLWGWWSTRHAARTTATPSNGAQVLGKPVGKPVEKPVGESFGDSYGDSMARRL